MPALAGVRLADARQQRRQHLFQAFAKHPLCGLLVVVLELGEHGAPPGGEPEQVDRGQVLVELIKVQQLAPHLRDWRPVTLVDTSVLLDVVTDDRAWAQWSADALARARDDGPLVINPIVYARGLGSLRPDRGSGRGSERRLPARGATLRGRVLAAKAFLDYRSRGGRRPSPLPDFYIGAHAAVRGHRLLARDAWLYRRYFPIVRLIAPDEGPVTAGRSRLTPP